ncbi:protein DpdJ [Chloroflexota bacterium]
MYSFDNMTERLALDLLNSLEERESELLIWGFLNGGFSEREIDDLAQEIAFKVEDYVSPSEILKVLEKGRLLFDFPSDQGKLYRTRFAESIRLFFNLRQMFQSDQWAIAPRLVADYRLSIQPRKYPPRNITRNQVLQRIKDYQSLSSLSEEVIHALLNSSKNREFLLSSFQVESTIQLLNNIRNSRSNGLIVCAGTGTGKTLAFYLPTFIRVIELLNKNEYWTQVLAIYPRNELLKDQFSEAYMQARRLDSIAKRDKGRKICIGTFFGPTPFVSTIYSVNQRWEAKGNGFICPFLRCPQCGKDLIWQRQDIEAKIEKLVCIDTECDYTIQPDEVILTRDRMQKTPPDILFTTTEMLNRQMGSSWNRQIFGLGLPREKSPYLMLLDEVHTYNGSHGAQVSMLIRRWSYMVRRPVQFVGLSATLRDAHGFFGQLVGLHSGAVKVVDAGEDLEEEGKEYNLVLRGDPVSGTSLLSTSIQTAMLLGRILDPPEHNPSSDVYGSRLFLFTDDLDVTNRLYHNLQDAEGLDSFGTPRANKQPLASLRSNEHPALARRFFEGQAWRLCEKIGHNLIPPNNRLRIGRTSSQDVGVDNMSNIIVATSSLEVGFNDPTVGAILQHKAPKGSASFIQRRGRAGRKRLTRPWNVVVLSDYGRDRLAYQAYDQLFNPVLDRPILPTGNRYILKIQAVHAFMDWMSFQIRGNTKGSIWEDFTKPGENSFQKQRQQLEANIILGLLENKERREQFSYYLGRALKITKEEVRALMWEPPRALMLSVLPTLYRRLTSDWRRLQVYPSDPKEDYIVPNLPLPDFISENLFSDLNVPEVTIRTSIHNSTDQDNWILPLTQALNVTAPGRVTRRFAVHHILTSHWVEPPDLSSQLQDIPLQQFCLLYDDIGIFQVYNTEGISGSVQDVRCIRPWVIEMTNTPSNVLTTSNAFLDWRSQLYYEQEGILSDIPSNLLLGELIRSVRFFTHNMRCPLRVRRFALGSKASIKTRKGKEQNSYIRFADTDSSSQIAMGFEHEVDGILFDCNITRAFAERILQGDGIQSCRTSYYLEKIVNDSTLGEFGNKFRLQWLGQIFLSIILEIALREKISVSDALDSFALNWDMEKVDTTLNTIFQIIDIESQEENAGHNEDKEKGKVHKAIRKLFEVEEVRSRLNSLASCLWQNPDDDFYNWLAKRVKVTLGSAFLQACYKLVPQFQPGDLYLDIESGPSLTQGNPDPENGEIIWITESMVGGGGVVEEIYRRYVEDPRRFFLLLEMALGLSDFEIVDKELINIINLTQTESEIASVFQQVRNATNNESLNIAKKSLMQSLANHHIYLTPAVMTALNSRIIRPGSSSMTDTLLQKILQYWFEEERRLGLEIDARVFCYLASSGAEYGEEIRQIMQNVGGIAEGSLSSFAILYSILWPRGSIIRERALESYNLYCTLPIADPKLIRDELIRKEETIPIEDPNWLNKTQAKLKEMGTASLRGDTNQRENLNQAILEFISQPIEVDYLHLYPYVSRVQINLNTITITLYLREAVQ